MKKNKRPVCYYCKTNESEEKCLYCTECRLKMAKGEIKPNYGVEKKIKCQLCGAEQLKVVCYTCLNEI